MKKILLGTTAIIALSTISAEAFAAEKIKLELGGFMRHYVALTNHDEVAVTALSAETRALDLGMKANSEVYFRGATTLDNGLSVSVDIQREADKGNNGNDVSSLTISSDAMGALTIGSTAAAADDFIIRVPQATGLDWSDGYGYGSVAGVTGDTQTFANQSTVDIEEAGGKDGKLKYISPSFGGLSVMASYTPAKGGNSDLSEGTNASNDEAAFGALFEGEVGGASVAVDAGQLRINGTSKINHFGASVGMAGFTLGGGYRTQKDDVTSDNAARDNANNGKAYEIGIGYETGPYTVSAGYMRTESDGTIATVGSNVDKHWALAAAYDMGAGVVLVADYWHAKSENEAAAIVAADGTVSGIVAGIEVGF